MSREIEKSGLTGINLGDIINVCQTEAEQSLVSTLLFVDDLSFLPDEVQPLAVELLMRARQSITEESAS